MDYYEAMAKYNSFIIESRKIHGEYTKTKLKYIEMTKKYDLCIDSHENLYTHNVLIMMKKNMDELEKKIKIVDDTLNKVYQEVMNAIFHDEQYKVED
jgi:hypothetical protein